jgi:Arabinose efflux permease
VLCALSDTLELLVAARFLQGFSGAAGVVLARAIVADTSVGNDAARRLSLMMVIGGVAPVLAPTVGGLVAASAGWRAVFWVLAGLVALMCVGVLAVVRETLPPAARHGGGLGTILGNAGKVLRRRRYLGYALTVVFAFAVMFSYIAASPFVLQNVIGLSPTVYGLAFGTNAVALILANVANARLAGWSRRARAAAARRRLRAAAGHRHAGRTAVRTGRAEVAGAGRALAGDGLPGPGVRQRHRAGTGPGARAGRYRFGLPGDLPVHWRRRCGPLGGPGRRA